MKPNLGKYSGGHVLAFVANLGKGSGNHDLSPNLAKSSEK